MTSITRTLALSLGLTATAIFLVLVGIVIWFDLARDASKPTAKQPRLSSITPRSSILATD